MIDLSPIKARIAAATPGPWQIWDGPEYVGGGADLCIGAGEKWLVNMDHRSCLTLQQLVDEGPSHAPVGDCPICSLGEADITGEQRANAEFIANARTDMEALVAEVGTLRYQLQQRIVNDMLAAIAVNNAMEEDNVTEEDDGA